MKRWILLLVILAVRNGCMMFDDMAYDGSAYADADAECLAKRSMGNVNVSQSVEPPY